MVVYMHESTRNNLSAEFLACEFRRVFAQEDLACACVAGLISCDDLLKKYNWFRSR